MPVARNHFATIWFSFQYIYIMSYDILCHGVKPLCFLYNACTFKKFNIFSLRLFDIQEIHWGCTFPMGYYIFQPDFKWHYSYRKLNWIFNGRYFLFFFRKTLKFNDSPLGSVICLTSTFFNGTNLNCRVSYMYIITKHIYNFVGNFVELKLLMHNFFSEMNQCAQVLVVSLLILVKMNDVSMDPRYTNLISLFLFENNDH